MAPSASSASREIAASRAQRHGRRAEQGCVGRRASSLSGEPEGAERTRAHGEIDRREHRTGESLGEHVCDLMAVEGGQGCGKSCIETADACRGEKLPSAPER